MSEIENALRLIKSGDLEVEYTSSRVKQGLYHLRVLNEGGFIANEVFDTLFDRYDKNMGHKGSESLFARLSKANRLSETAKCCRELTKALADDFICELQLDVIGSEAESMKISAILYISTPSLVMICKNVPLNSEEKEIIMPATYECIKSTDISKVRKAGEMVTEITV